MSGVTAMLGIGTPVGFDGEVFTVSGLESGRAVLSGHDGRVLVIALAALLSDPSTRIGHLHGDSVSALGPVLDDLPPSGVTGAAQRLAHIREVLTGYRSGVAAIAEPGEPRAAFHPGLPLADRLAAKAAELGVSTRTLQRWVGRVRQAGAAGAVDGRSLRGADVLRGVDTRWLAMVRIVLAEHTDASRPTKALVLRRVVERLEAEHGPGTVAAPGQKKALAVLSEVARGTNAFTGSTSGKRSIAGRPGGVYGRLRPTRPGEYVLVDTTPLDVFAMDAATGRWVRVELTVAVDLFSRVVTGLRCTPFSTKAVDAALVLFETVAPDALRPGGGLLPYAGLPDVVVTDAERTEFAARSVPTPAETLVVDHGKVFLSEHLLAVCERLGISVQPARPLTPTDKAVVERFFKTLNSGLLAALPGYKGPDIASRGRDPQGCTFFFLDELEQVIREWVAEVYHRRVHSRLVEPGFPGLGLSPAEMFAAGLARAGALRVPAHPHLAFDFLPVAWRTIQHYGVEVNRLRYDGPALTGYRNRRSPFTGVHAGKWPLRFDPDDISRVFFQDPADSAWHVLTWEHAERVEAPFSTDTLSFARSLALSGNRHVDDATALSQLLQRWDAGLARHPVERRAALRADGIRLSALLPSLSAEAADHALWPSPAAPAVPAGGDSGFVFDGEDEDELSAPAGDEEFYAGALEVLR